MIVTRKDVDCLSNILKGSFPSIIFMVTEIPLKKSVAPSTKCYESINDCPSSSVSMYLPTEGWFPEFYWYEDESESYWKGSEMSGHWRLRDTPVPVLSFQGSATVREFAAFSDDTPSHLGQSSFLMSYNMDDPEQMRMKAKVNRLLGKVVTSKTRLINWRSRQEMPVRPFVVWAGHDAIRWCREDPSRVLNFSCPYIGDCSAWIPA
jgi:hypothetical protein